MLERCYIVGIDALHLLVGEAENALQRLADRVVFVEMIIAVKVLDHDLIHIVVATEDIEVLTAADRHRAKEVHLSRDLTIHGNLAQGIEVSSTGGKIERHGSAGYPLFAEFGHQFFSISI